MNGIHLLYRVAKKKQSTGYASKTETVSLVVVLMNPVLLSFAYPNRLKCVKASTFTLHIRSMGEETFTGCLHQLAASQTTLPAELSGPIHIDGPYGGEWLSDFGDHDLVVLIAGGIGITPAHSILRTINCRLQDGDDPSAGVCWVLLLSRPLLSSHPISSHALSFAFMRNAGLTTLTCCLSA